ncbi:MULTISPECIES: ROK family transcriptional regulator [Cellulomonas]|uniref:ROK family protein n=1 Tax=Cellulomonas gilvus (strain ATCC 13127 / NRRL B-14078) TaxID=593907 RepID=F8A153_CELGA|nr:MULTISPECIES: ROK family transcriptional regulator [Cellulomonas]AEI12811.1 ROK family protein [Cellulomonas gilvus ATCC 13127]MCR6689437.1 ROK family transcriptional regulator [Cellulomonas sp.]
MSRPAGAAGSQSSLREANRQLVVETVKRYGGLTQVELATATGLSQATVSTIVRELYAAGVVDTVATTRSGRRAQMVTLARRVGLAAGIQIGHRHLRVALGDFSHEILAEQTLPLPVEHRVDTTLDRVALLVVDLLERVGASLQDIVGMGVGVPAPVDAATGMISVHGIMPGWDDVHLGQVLSKRLDLPVYVDNDANLGAFAESTAGAARDFSDSLFVRASYGVGAGIVLGNQVFRGFAGTAGEIGHLTVAPDGDECRCGRRGCLDTVVGSSALLDAIGPVPGIASLRDVVQRANQGDERCGDAVAEAGSVIGTAVAGLALAVNPQVVVIGGELAETGETLVAPLRAALQRYALPNRIAPLEVVRAGLGSRAEMVGALALAVQSTDVPLSVEETVDVGGLG